MPTSGIRKLKQIFTKETPMSCKRFHENNVIFRAAVLFLILGWGGSLQAQNGNTDTAEKTWTDTAKEKTGEAVQVVGETAEKVYDSAVVTADQALHPAAESARDRIEHRADKPITEAEADRSAFRTMLVVGGIILAIIILWFLLRSRTTKVVHEVPPGHTPRVD